MIIRNDDVGFDTAIGPFMQFCELCDKYGFRILQAITPRGKPEAPIVATRNGEQIRRRGGDYTFAQNGPVLQYLLSRDDLIGVHGLYHTPTVEDWEIEEAIALLISWGLTPTYYCPPYAGLGELGDWSERMSGLKVSAQTQRLEDYLKSGTPTAEIVYLHSWRFHRGGHTLEDLGQCLKRLSATSDTT